MEKIIESIINEILTKNKELKKDWFRQINELFPIYNEYAKLMMTYAKEKITAIDLFYFSFFNLINSALFSSNPSEFFTISSLYNNLLFNLNERKKISNNKKLQDIVEDIIRYAKKGFEIADKNIFLKYYKTFKTRSEYLEKGLIKEFHDSLLILFTKLTEFQKYRDVYMYLITPFYLINNFLSDFNIEKEKILCYHFLNEFVNLLKNFHFLLNYETSKELQNKFYDSTRLV